jgi:hypothetical protein
MSIAADMDRLAVAGTTTVQLSAHLSPGARPRWQITATVWDQFEGVSHYVDDAYSLAGLVQSAANAIEGEPLGAGEVA